MGDAYFEKSYQKALEAIAISKAVMSAQTARAILEDIVRENSTSLATVIKNTGAFGAFLYGFLERILLPFGMHLLILIPLMMTPMGGSLLVGGAMVEGPANIYNAILNTPGAMFDVNISPFLMNGKPLIVVGYAAIAFTIYKTSFEINLTV